MDEKEMIEEEISNFTDIFIEAANLEYKKIIEADKRLKPTLECFKELCSTEKGYLYFLVLFSPHGIVAGTKLCNMIENHIRTLSPKTQKIMESIIEFIKIKGHTTILTKMAYQALQDKSYQIFPEYINELKKTISRQENSLIDSYRLVLKFIDNDRLTTVPQFYNIVDKERDWKGKKATKETMIRKTQEALSNKQCFSMFKSKKEGRYYRIEDIVDAAISLEYVRQEYKWSVIEEMKYKDNSRTKTDLDSEGFETSERNGSGI